MKAALLRAPGDLHIEEIPLPTVSSGELLVRMKACGVCGTDIEKFRGEGVTSPMLGHEVVGVVAEVGANIDGFQPGDRVFVHHHVPCYTCHYCRHGDYTMCEDFAKTTIEPCGFAEYFKVPRELVQRKAVLRLPDELGFEEATFIEPLGCCIRGIGKLALYPGDSAVILGLGPTGLLQTQLLKTSGASLIIGVDILNFRIQLAYRLGADRVLNAKESSVADEIRRATDSRGPDAVIVSTSSVSALEFGLNVVRKGGKVLLFGSPPRGSKFSSDASQLFIRGLTLLTSYSTSEKETNQALELLRTKRLSVAPLVTHRYALSETKVAIDTASSSNDVVKVIVSP